MHNESESVTSISRADLAPREGWAPERTLDYSSMKSSKRPTSASNGLSSSTTTHWKLPEVMNIRYIYMPPSYSHP